MAISLTRSDNQISKAIGMLSTMFSQMMHIDTYTVSISDEISYSKNYLEIEMLRYKDEFEIFWNVDEAVFDFMTVKFTLQPILENSIRHGFAKLGGKGLIRVDVCLFEETIVFTVTDNGIGQTEKWIEILNNELQETTPLIGEHIGIRNVNQRIKLIFGGRYGVSLYKNEEAGLSVKIVIPKVKKEP